MHIYLTHANTHMYTPASGGGPKLGELRPSGVMCPSVLTRRRGAFRNTAACASVCGTYSNIYICNIYIYMYVYMYVYI